MHIEIACWLRASSYFPEIEVELPYDPHALPYDLILDLMQERKETYLYKAAVAFPYGIRRFEQVSLPPLVKEHVATVAVVKRFWTLLLADGVDPVESKPDDALSFLPVYGSDDLLLARWSRLSLASDRRLFADLWNGRRAAEYRCRLLEEEVSAVPLPDPFRVALRGTTLL